jgi:hypothetical protein
MSKTYYRAVHSTGRVHIRASERPYSHAVVGPRPGANRFCGRFDLAQKVLGEKYLFDGAEVVRAEEITAKEFAQLGRANKRKFAVEFMGKTFTHTVDSASTAPLFAVGFFEAAHVERHPVPMCWLENAQDAVRYCESLAAKYGEEKFADRVEFAKARLATIEAQIAQGFHVVNVEESVRVSWHSREDFAEQDLASQCTPGFKTRERLTIRAL